MSFPLEVVIALVVAAGASLLLWRFVFAPPADQGRTIRVSGNIEVTEVQVAFKLPGRVQQRLVDEGMLVHKGEVGSPAGGGRSAGDWVRGAGSFRSPRRPWPRCWPAPGRGNRGGQGRTGEGRVEPEGADRRFPPQADRLGRAALRPATVDRERAKLDYQRASKLIASKTIAPEEYDRVSAAYAVAVEKARDAAEQLSLVQEGPRSEDIDQARALRDQARAQYDLVKAGPPARISTRPGRGLIRPRARSAWPRRG